MICDHATAVSRGADIVDLKGLIYVAVSSGERKENRS